MNDERIVELTLKHMRNEISEPESAELKAWVDSSQRNKDFFDDMNNEELLKEDLLILSKIDVGKHYRKVQKKIKPTGLLVSLSKLASSLIRGLRLR